MLKRFALFLLVLPGSFASVMPAYGQTDPVDSLTRALTNAKHDTDKLRILVQLSEQNEFSDALKYGQPAIELADKLIANRSNKPFLLMLNKYKAVAVTNIGLQYENQGDILKALDQYILSSKIWEASGDRKGQASSLNDVGFIFEHQGDIPKALDHYGRSLKIREEIGDKKGIAESVNNIGFIYKSQGDFTNALTYYNRTLKLYEEMRLPNGQPEDKVGIGRTLNNIGHVYHNQGDLSKALIYYNRSLKLHEEAGNKEGIATLLGNIGAIYRNQGDLVKALEYGKNSLHLYKKMHDIKSSGIALNSIAAVHMKQKKYALALAYSDSALTIAYQMSFPSSIQNTEKLRAKIDSARGNMKGAFEHYKQYIIYRDSINNENTRKAGVKNQLKYEYDKKEAVMKETQEKERAISEEKNRFQKIIIWSLVLGFLLVLIFAIFIFRTLRITHLQKAIIEEKQREILDSIHYAKRIQRSLLPTEKYINRNLVQLQN